MLKYASGETPMVGDVVEYVDESGRRFVKTVTNVDGLIYVGDYMYIDAPEHRLLRRATTAPAPADERFAVGAVWLSSDLSWSHAARSENGWHNVFWGPDSRDLIETRQFATQNLPKRATLTYAGNLQGLIDFLVAWGKAAKHCPICGSTEGNTGQFCGRCCLLELSKPSAPPVDAASLAAKQRDRHRAEAEALQEWYRAFHETVTRVLAEEAPRARVVTDMARHLGRIAFVGWIDFGQGVRAEVYGGAREGGCGIAHDTKCEIEKAKLKLGARALKGAG